MYIYLYLKIQTMNHPTFTNGHFAKILLVVMKWFKKTFKNGLVNGFLRNLQKLIRPLFIIWIDLLIFILFKKTANSTFKKIGTYNEYYNKNYNNI